MVLAPALIGVLIVRIDPIPFILDAVSRGSATFGPTTVVFGLSAATIGIALVVYSAVFGKPRTAVGLYVLLLPLLSLFHRVGGVTVDTVYDEPIVISLSTFLLFLLAAVFYLRGIKMRKPGESTFRVFEKLLWGYALMGSAVQVFNNSVVDAFLVSVDGLWEFVLLFYVMAAVTESGDDLRYFFGCIAGSLMGGFLLTIGNNVFFERYSISDFSMRFVYATSSPGAVAVHGLMGMVLILYLARSSASIRKRVFWQAISFILIGLVILTQTRGGIVAFIWLGLLFLYRSERSQFAVYFLIPAFLSVLLLQDQIVRVLEYRPLSLDLMSIESVSSRLEVWKLSVPITFSNCLAGFGIGNTPGIMIFHGLLVNSHNLTFYLLQDVGIIATIGFLSLLFYTIWQLLLASFSKSISSQQGNVAVYIMVALVMWFSYANLNGLSITTHSWSGAHEEETMLFYTILYLGRTAISISRSKNPKAFLEARG